MYADADLPDSEANNFAAALNMLELAKEARTVKDKKAWQALTDEAQRKFMAEILQPAGANYVKIGNILTRIENEYGAVDEESLTPEKLDELLTKDEQALILSFMEYNAALADAQVDACKKWLKHNHSVRSKGPDYWVDAILLRYLDGKDFTTGYDKRIDAVSVEDVRALLASLYEAGKVEYIIRKK